ncbi:MAG TPA: isoprenylcysteine carboxylmethyltransferase family protein [Polyangiaceae bacterium]|nr:isoprenylcysteine carboxylmethyltransferase family protein [Polyangiaceae bacterium]
MGTRAMSLETRSVHFTLRTLAALAIVLFVSAGALGYWQAWLWLALQAVTVFAANAYLLRHDRQLLERRFAFDEEGEQQPEQRRLAALLRLFTLGLLVVAGLDRRWGWSHVPLWVVTVASVVFVVGAALVFEVMRVNRYASSVIELATKQTVVSSGPYSLVRHPMYSGFLLGTLATPLMLGSYVAELFFPPLCGVFVLRMLAEERFLSGSLPGYDDFLRETPKRLVPGLW